MDENREIRLARIDLRDPVKSLCLFRVQSYMGMCLKKSTHAPVRSRNRRIRSTGSRVEWKLHVSSEIGFFFFIIFFIRTEVELMHTNAGNEVS